MKKIYVKEWMLFQPYERQDEVDTYYVNVANHIAGCLKDFVGGRYPEHSVHGIAIYLTLWFQNVISQTGIWQAFSEECRKRYGCLVPFMTPEKKRLLSGRSESGRFAVSAMALSSMHGETGWWRIESRESGF